MHLTERFLLLGGKTSFLKLVRWRLNVVFGDLAGAYSKNAVNIRSQEKLGMKTRDRAP
jgi:hypothetical protein